MKKLLKNNATTIALISLFVILSFISPEFLTARNISNLTRQVTLIGIMSIGMTLVILIGGIDLSVGSVVGLSAISVTLMMQAGINVWLSMLLTIILCGLLIGMFNGFMIAKYRIPPFIITLGMMTIARGLALTLSNGGSVPVTDSLFPMIGGEYIPVVVSGLILAILFAMLIAFSVKQIKQNRKNIHPILPIIFMLATSLAAVSIVYLNYMGIPVPVIIFAFIAALGIITLNKTKFGRRLYAVGGNEDAARLSGINIFRTKLTVFTVMSVLACVSGIVLASRLNGASPNLGNMFELDTIAAVVIGGTSLSGGVGSITGSIIGTLLIGTLDNGMSLLNVNTFYQLIAKGIIIILAVWFDVSNKQNKSC